MSSPEAFWARVTKQDGDGCWEWRGSKLKFGYGAAWHLGRASGAHRVAWRLAHGPIPDGLYVLHRCDNPACARPDHLFLGTHADNMADMARKGRQRRGEANLSSRLSVNAVRAIRRRYEGGGESHRSLARTFGVAPNAIRKIVKRHTWAEV
jgi:hypothetical protein